ncbi:pseudouridine synthase, partial [Erysipelothrix rhusiopathiae]|nr:pseudouridine synthase [Erysipelothrix rhusiopathiae]
FMNYPKMIFPIGRLDKDSSGLILLTNDGDIVNKILREEYGHDLESVTTCIQKLKAAGIRTCVHIINGFPQETPEMMLETAD